MCVYLDVGNIVLALLRYKQLLLHDLGPHPEYKCSISIDAVTKLSHYSNCGSASSSIKPRLDTYFHHAENVIREMEVNGQLSLSGLIDGDDVATPEHADDDQVEHITALSCARSEAAPVGPCDVHGVVGAVCSHTIPLRSCFIDMKTPEQFIYYIVILMALLKMATGRVRDVFVDFGCQLKKTFQRFGSQHESKMPSGWKELRILVNWMHGNSHDLSCQLQHCGRYIQGAGHKDGENNERLWSMTKVCGRSCLHAFLNVCVSA